MFKLFPYQSGDFKGVINYLFSKGRENLIKVEVSSKYAEIIDENVIIRQHNDENHWSSESRYDLYAIISF